MRGENNWNRSSREKEEIRISNSRAMGIMILIALLFVFQVATFIIHKSGTPEPVAVESVAEEIAEEEAAVSLFAFDPNTVSADSLQLMGFTPRQALTIINYRNKGGVFRRKEDFAKMYVVDSSRYRMLESYISIPPQSVPVGKGGNTKVTKKVQPDIPVLNSAKASEIGSVYGDKVVKNRYMCNLNTADSAALVKLYGIGGHYARKIMQYRSRLGGSFADTRQLLEIEGFDMQRFERIEGNIFVREEDIRKISLSGADRGFLEKHPYIGPYAARGMEMLLEIRGKDFFASDVHLLEELVKEHVISEQNARRLKVYLVHL